MKLVRFEHKGQPRIGQVENETVTELEVDTESAASTPPIVTAAREGNNDKTGEEFKYNSLDLLAPVSRPSKIICIGLNYRDHALEGDNEIPDEPLLFGKASSAVIGPHDQIIYPHDIEQLDYEAELAVVIGEQGRRIPTDEALDHVAGMTVFNDVTARDVQYRVSQFFRGKSYDTFAPMGPALVTPDSLDTTNLPIQARVNNTLRQDSNTAELIFDVSSVVESVSQSMTLYPGDVIATGTPSGVGMHRDPPELLNVGDEVTVEIEGIGSLQNPIVSEET